MKVQQLLGACHLAKLRTALTMTQNPPLESQQDVHFTMDEQAQRWTPKGPIHFTLGVKDGSVPVHAVSLGSDLKSDIAEMAASRMHELLVFKRLLPPVLP